MQALLTSMCVRRDATPCLCRTTGAASLADDALGAKVFGPLGLIVAVRDADEMRAVAICVACQLTCTLHLDDADTHDMRQLTALEEENTRPTKIVAVPALNREMLQDVMRRKP